MIAPYAEITYESICDECRELVGQIDARRWVVGDRAILIDKQYGEHTIDDFSRDIGMNKNTVYGWRRVAEFYPESVRRTILNAFPNLTYSHYKDALRCDDLDMAIQWLEQVSAEGWSPDQAAYKLTLARSEGIDNGASEGSADRDTLRSIEGFVMREYDTRGGDYVVKIIVDKMGLDYLQKAHTVTIKAK
jgi:hypothetical protein